jgi:hypothetical protein
MDNIRALISKINDRNIQRKRESGFTTYALASVLLIILYKLFDIFQSIDFKSDIAGKTSVISISFNICFAIFGLMLMFDRDNQRFYSVKFIKSKQSKYFYESFFRLALLLLPAVFSFIYYYYNSNDIKVRNDHGAATSLDVYFFICLVFSFLLVVAFVLSEIEDLISLIKNNRVKYISYFTNKFSIKNAASLNLIFFVLIIYISISFYFIYNTEYKFDKYVVSKCVFLSYASLFLISKIITINNRDIYSLKMENFEQEIILSKLTDDEIIKKFKENFSGIFLEDWLFEHSSQLEEIEKETIDKLNSINIESKESKKVKSTFFNTINRLKNAIVELKNADNLTKEQELLVKDFEDFIVKKEDNIKSWEGSK